MECARAKVQRENKGIDWTGDGIETVHLPARRNIVGGQEMYMNLKNRSTHGDAPSLCLCTRPYLPNTPTELQRQNWLLSISSPPNHIGSSQLAVFEGGQ